jgi:hypothetical protein
VENRAPSAARFPEKWNRFSGKKTRQVDNLAHVLIAKVSTLWRNMR